MEPPVNFVCRSSKHRLKLSVCTFPFGMKPVGFDRFPSLFFLQVFRHFGLNSFWKNILAARLPKANPKQNKNLTPAKVHPVLAGALARLALRGWCRFQSACRPI